MSTESLRRRIATTIAIREMLLKHPDGMTTVQLSGKLNTSAQYIKNILYSEYGFYIDRYMTSPRLTAVWCCVEVPENCPLPEKNK